MSVSEKNMMKHHIRVRFKILIYSEKKYRHVQKIISILSSTLSLTSTQTNHNYVINASSMIHLLSDFCFQTTQVMIQMLV